MFFLRHMGVMRCELSAWSFFAAWSYCAVGLVHLFSSQHGRNAWSYYAVRVLHGCTARHGRTAWLNCNAVLYCVVVLRGVVVLHGCSVLRGRTALYYGVINNSSKT